MKKFPSLQRAFHGLETWREFALRIAARITRNPKYIEIFYEIHNGRLAKKFTTKDCIKIKNVRLPLLNDKDYEGFWASAFYDTFAAYYFYDDRYDKKTFKILNDILGEGPYGCVNDKVNVQINPGDVVIDAGSWIGDFAAYSSVRGGGNFCF